MMSPQAGAIRVDPLPQLFPTADQRLMRHFNHTSFGGPAIFVRLSRNQPGVHKSLNNPLKRRGQVAWDINSRSLTRRFVSSVPSPGCVSRRKIRRQSVTLGLVETMENRIGLVFDAPSSPPISRYAAPVSRPPSRRSHNSRKAY